MQMSIERRGFGNLELDRQKQINTLQIFNDNVSTIIQDYQYRVDFISDGQSFSLEVLLPPDFPSIRPTVLIKPENVSHPWVREDGTVIGSPGLNSFGIHSDLGRVVQAIKREFVIHPPKLRNNQQSNIPLNRGHSLVNGSASYQNPTQQISLPQHSSRQSNLPISVPGESSIPGLSKLSYAELKELNENPTALKIFIQNLPPIKASKEIDKNMTEVKSKIQHFFTKRHEFTDQIETKRAELLQDHDRYINIRQDLWDTVGAIKEHQTRFSETSLCELMHNASVADEEQSDKCAEKFLAGNLDIDQFVSDYIKVRSDHHKKKVAVEKKKFAAN